MREDMKTPCPTCASSGHHGVYVGRTWQVCPECNDTGAVESVRRLSFTGEDVIALALVIGGAQDPSDWYGATPDDVREGAAERVRALASRMEAALATEPDA